MIIEKIHFLDGQYRIIEFDSMSSSEEVRHFVPQCCPFLSDIRQ